MSVNVGQCCETNGAMDDSAGCQPPPRGLRGKSQSITVDERVRADKAKGKNGENGQTRLDWVKMIPLEGSYWGGK
jgi:hypothetical protein